MDTELEALHQRLKENADKLIERATQRRISHRGTGNRTKRLDNLLQPVFARIDFSKHTPWPLWIDDVLAGVCRLDWYRADERSIPLSATNLIQIFSTLPVITVYDISHLLVLGERQARRYMKACELAYPYLERGFMDDDIYLMRYPST